MVANTWEEHHEDLLETTKEVWVFNINDTIEVELTPEGIRYIQQSDSSDAFLSNIKGNRLRIQFWKFANFFWPVLYIGKPLYIVDGSITLFRDKTADELVAESKWKTITTIEGKYNLVHE